ncbi:MAG: hypothetical protein WCV99_09310 [Sterolibacterium sp.]|jgi:hypothetical protein
MSALFLLFVAAVAAIIAFSILRFLPRGYRVPGLIGLVLWLAYGGALGISGVVANATILPPGLFYLLAPTIMLVMFMARSSVGLTIATSVPIWFLTGMESFRLVVEGFLHMLWQDGQLPRMLTYHGANFDILIGISAPIMAWLIASRRISDRWALAWQAAGIAMLANVAIRAVLTSPGPLNFIATEVPNMAIGTFPFTFIPGLMVPLALVLHVLSIRALRIRAPLSARYTSA